MNANQQNQSGRRLAVVLHNRKHPFPIGVLVLIGIVVLLGVVAFINSRENPEVKALREELRRDAEDFRRSRE